MPQQKDQNFDDRVEHFQKKIYASMKGQIRLQLIKQELKQLVLDQKSQSLKILDLAGGLGQLSIWLASLGHQVTYIDISQKMMAKAQQLAKEQDVYEQIIWICAPFQQVLTHSEQFLAKHMNECDLILCHALLEWLHEPDSGLSQILRFATKTSAISLLFYNLQAVKLHNVLRGNFYKVNSEKFSGEPGSLTPLNPLLPDQIRNIIMEQGFKIETEMGLRSFYDYLSVAVRNKISTEDILAMEQQLCHQQPFIDMARYVHFLIKS